MKRFKHPFTLVELLCVIIVIALLAAISIKITQIAYRRADETKTKTVMEIIRAANEQYKAKKGYYYPNSGSAYSEDGFYYIPLDPDFLGDAYETCRNIAKENGNDDKIRDAWGNAIHYRSPGKYNTGTYDMYSFGRDKSAGDAEKVKHIPGDGDDIANFKNPDLN